MKTAQKFDSYLAAMGLNVAQTGSSMGLELMMAARAVSGLGSGARLIRFKEAVTGGDGRYEVVCYPHQLGFLKEYLGGGVGYKTIGMELLEAEMVQPD